MRRFTFLICFLLLSIVETYGQHSDDPKNPEVVPAVAVSPSFPGGLLAFDDFVKDNLKYPHKAKLAGTVFISITVHPDGSLTDIRALGGHCDQCERNAIDVVKKMPNWIPGESDSVVITMRTLVKIKFEP
jgi:TonB family protein